MNKNDFLIGTNYENKQLLHQYRGSDSHIVIPDGVYLVVNGCFSGSEVKGISLPDSVEYISKSAFSEDAAALADHRGFCIAGKFLLNYMGEEETVEIPPSVTVLSEHCITGSNVKKVILHSGICHIHSGAIKAPKVEEIIIPADCPVKSIPDYCFSFLNSLRFISLPNSVESLGTEAFGFCGALEQIKLPTELKSIGNKCFSQCDSLCGLSFGEKLESIGNYAFHNCSSLKDLKLPQSLKHIGQNAFQGCMGLDSSILPDSVFEGLSTEQREELIGAVGISDENGFIIANRRLIRYVGNSKSLSVPEGVEEIAEAAFPWLLCPTDIQLPESLQLFGESKLAANTRINLPRGYLKQSRKFPQKFLLNLLEGPWAEQYDTEDAAYLSLFQSNKKILNLALKRLEEAPQKSAEIFLSICDRPELKAKNYESIAVFLYAHSGKIDHALISEFCQKAAKAKATVAVKALQKFTDTSPKSFSHPIEEFCSTAFPLALLEKEIKNAGLSMKQFEKVLYKDSEKYAPASAVICAIAPYMALMNEASDCDTGLLRLKLIQGSDRVAEALDKESFISALLDAVNEEQLLLHPQLCLPFCRFAPAHKITELFDLMKKWSERNIYGILGTVAISVARSAILLSDSHEAMVYAENKGFLESYAAIHKTDVRTLRDSVLSDFGLDENDSLRLDLGSTAVVAYLNAELGISLYDEASGELLKRLPTEGADADKLSKASLTLGSLKKKLKKVLKPRLDSLFADFLSGRGEEGKYWLSSCNANPLFRRLARLLVWQQRGRFFVMGQDCAVDIEGKPFSVELSEPVFVAHPMDMSKAQLEAWQHFFVSHGLKQPFEQLWEPLADFRGVKSSRYKGIPLPFSYFTNKTAHGIGIRDYDQHSIIYIDFDDCLVSADRIDCQRYHIDPTDRFELSYISVQRRSYRSNHILAYLDKICCRECVLHDDEKLAPLLSNLTAPQLRELLQLAKHNKCTKVTPLITERLALADYEEMKEFLL